MFEKTELRKSEERGERTSSQEREVEEKDRGKLASRASYLLVLLG